MENFTCRFGERLQDSCRLTAFNRQLRGLRADTGGRRVGNEIAAAPSIRRGYHGRTTIRDLIGRLDEYLPWFPAGRQPPFAAESPAAIRQLRQSKNETGLSII
jgi:hypothetical protein